LRRCGHPAKKQVGGFLLGHRREHLGVLACDTQHFPARDDEPRFGCMLEPDAKTGIGVARHLLERVKKDETRTACGDRGGDLQHRIGFAEGNVECLCDCIDDTVESTCRRQVAEPGAARIVA